MRLTAEEAWDLQSDVSKSPSEHGKDSRFLSQFDPS